MFLYSSIKGGCAPCLLDLVRVKSESCEPNVFQHQEQELNAFDLGGRQFISSHVAQLQFCASFVTKQMIFDETERQIDKTEM